ncbi:LysR substrate-binding domain-containing protein [Serratia entomophila]|uniref:LysR substrate-binding domain-containing protein n=1 Tax=Serratia entomophila TaxID=42906 RepID=UPI002177472E|nr:LysR family transcriptional regulator [Serratia entomophila]CAI1106036.1 D-malate degradation protein R [Serratia entomophila]CAI1106867.1 D-malate degradation protein R [Serratia entomophila]CAI1114243.1 D-malate degradation protein R [Serratia entomophila]CAI1714241.1 D-malate degradation protein R [Serratia entomophila]CAI1891677.1 D-malate degradation protein R [Serratia entomophila]
MKNPKIETLWTHLHWLTVLAEQGSFTRAAERLEVSKAAMSQKIKEIETLAGVPLVQRTTRSVRLTEAGLRLVEELRQPFAQIKQSFSGVCDSAGPLRGTVRVTAPVAFARQQLVPRITGFLRANPEVRVQLEVSDRLVSLTREGFDLAIRHSDSLPETHVAWRLCPTQTLAVASADYIAAHGMPASPAELERHQCLYYPRGGEQPGWRFVAREAAAGGEMRVPVSGPFATNNSESIRDAALEGLGIALLPDFSARRALAGGQLIEVLPAWRPIGAFADALYVVRPYAPQVSRTVAAFGSYLRGAFAKGFSAG